MRIKALMGSSSGSSSTSSASRLPGSQPFLPQKPRLCSPPICCSMHTCPGSYTLLSHLHVRLSMLSGGAPRHEALGQTLSPPLRQNPGGRGSGAKQLQRASEGRGSRRAGRSWAWGPILELVPCSSDCLTLTPAAHPPVPLSSARAQSAEIPASASTCPCASETSGPARISSKADSLKCLWRRQSCGEHPVCPQSSSTALVEEPDACGPLWREVLA